MIMGERVILPIFSGYFFQAMKNYQNSRGILNIPSNLPTHIFMAQPAVKKLLSTSGVYLIWIKFPPLWAVL